jgi:hypothetical protein
MLSLDEEQDRKYRTDIRRALTRWVTAP